MDDLDRILLSEDEVSPSPGFQASVMRTVRRQAEVPEPIPFPWRLSTVSVAGLSLLCAMLLRLAPASWSLGALAVARDVLAAIGPSLDVLGWVALVVLASSILPLVSFDLAQD